MKKIIDNNTIIVFNKNILKRYEHNLNDGIIILFNVESEEIWLGNSGSKEIINLIDGKKTIQEIYSKILSNYAQEALEKVVESLNLIVEDLYNKNFIEIKDS